MGGVILNVTGTAMSGFEAVYFLALMLSTVVTGGVAAYAWRHRHVRAAKLFVVMMTVVFVWDVLFALTILSRDPAATWLWIRSYMSCVVVIPLLWFTFATVYTGQGRWLTPLTLAALSLIPTASLALLWSNDSHHLFFKEVVLDRSRFLTVVAYHGALWMWVHVVYSYALIVGGMLLLPWMALSSFRLYRAQALALLVGTAAPFVPNLLVTFGWIRQPMTFLGFTITGVILGWAMFRYRLLDLKPVARGALIDRMSDGMMALDPANRIVDVNPVMARILGVPSAQMLGRDAAAVLPRGQDWSARLAAPFAPEAVMRDEVAIHEDGSERYYDLLVSPLLDRRGRSTGRLVLLHDITRRRKAEEELRRYAAELQSSNAELDAFAHTVAHDLKNPLGGLIGYCSLMEEHASTVQPQEFGDYAKAILGLGSKMTAIVNELLLLSSVRKVSAVQQQPLDMSAVVAEALKRFESRIRERRARVAVAERWPTALGHAPWVEEVWVNYVSNALKYGGDPLRLELGYDAAAGGQLRFWCRDNGPGMNAEDQSRLFTEFTRLSQARAEGHGLGLSIVRRIVEKLGGGAGVESAKGCGSTFWFTLPAAAAVATNDGSRRMAAGATIPNARPLPTSVVDV